MESAMFKHTSRESGFLKYFPGVQNPIGVNGIASLKIHFNPNISLPSFNIVVEAEPPDVKFTISSDAVNQFFKVSLYQCIFKISSPFPIIQSVSSLNKV
jgi:hypothetical protein